MRKDSQLNLRDEAGHVLAFPTPISVTDWQGDAEVLDRLVDLIKERMESQAGVTFSNAGGWQSEGEVLNWGDPAVDVLRREILRAVRHQTDFLAEGPYKCRFNPIAWANVNAAGDFNRPHRHGTAHWSGVLYLKTPKENEGGKIAFHDPRSAVGILPTPGTPFGESVAITPKPGMMLVFPGWLEHMVWPHRGTEPRITIAYNVMLSDFQKLGD